jgi:hypothetical protein
MANKGAIKLKLFEELPLTGSGDSNIRLPAQDELTNTMRCKSYIHMSHRELAILSYAFNPQLVFKNNNALYDGLISYEIKVKGVEWDYKNSSGRRAVICMCLF